ncbi:MAG TPA: ASKHA domain-containing protein [Anaerovoracaceae bacterium]|nr:ASKHA domain-containing protein [Anaerovoracaceae bacterium]
MKITFMPNNITGIADSNESILDVASRVGVNIDGNCAGAGTCGKCKVKIVDGNVKLTKEQDLVLTKHEYENNYRLACCTKAKSDIVVLVPETETITSRKEKLLKLPDWFNFDVNVVKKCLNIKKSNLEKQESIEKKLKYSLGKENLFIDRDVLKMLNEETELTVTVLDDYVVDLEHGNTENENYGLALDIGTTTVVFMLWNLSTKKIVDIKAVTNPQGVYGADVISRINKNNETNGEHLLHKTLINKMNEIIKGFENKNGIKSTNIYKITACGNTTMSHFLWDVETRSLAVSPFAPVFCDYQVTNAKSLGININPLAYVELLPNIAGHVGSDITAGIITTDLMNRDKGHLFIDIGTNGEIVLAGKDCVYTCSTAAGPAFEGSSIAMGIRAAEGAVEKVKISEKGVEIKVIGDCTPVGICGSGIIDAIGQMIKWKIIDKTGKINGPSKLEKLGVSEEVIDRIVKDEKGYSFILFDDNKGSIVKVTQKDVREVQLAKAAIAAGISTMMSFANLDKEDLVNISIAGAFGSYVDIDNAINLGLIPNIEKSKIISIGNSAGIGTSMALLSKKTIEETKYVANEIKHIELAALNEFQDEYIKAMMF